jgi:hypothetical protein
MTKRAMTAAEMGRLRWKGLNKGQRAEIARAGGLARAANMRAQFSETSDAAALRSKALRARSNAIRRCYNASCRSYSAYGGRGITVCTRWLVSADAFIEDMGLPDSRALTLDRINVDGNYEPGNCRWATWAVQHGNRRVKEKKVVERGSRRPMGRPRTVVFESSSGEEKTASEMALAARVPVGRIYAAAKDGRPICVAGAIFRKKELTAR